VLRHCFTALFLLGGLVNTFVYVGLDRHARRLISNTSSRRVPFNIAFGGSEEFDDQSQQESFASDVDVLSGQNTVEGERSMPTEKELSFCIGDVVEVRKSGGPWRTGYVTSVSPLKVAEEWNCVRGTAHSWAEVRCGQQQPLPLP